MTLAFHPDDPGSIPGWTCFISTFNFLIEDRLLDTSEVLALKNARPQGGVCIENSGYFVHLLHWFAMEIASPLLDSFRAPPEDRMTNSSCLLKGKGNPDLSIVCSNY